MGLYTYNKEKRQIVQNIISNIHGTVEKGRRQTMYIIMCVCVCVYLCVLGGNRLCVPSVVLREIV